MGDQFISHDPQKLEGKLKAKTEIRKTNDGSDGLRFPYCVVNAMCLTAAHLGCWQIPKMIELMLLPSCFAAKNEFAPRTKNNHFLGKTFDQPLNGWFGKETTPKDVHTPLYLWRSPRNEAHFGEAGKVWQACLRFVILRSL